RRSQRDQSDSIKFGNEKLIKDLLPTLDNLERAIQSANEQQLTGPLLEGISLTHKQFLETLTKLGLLQISSLGEEFDPAKHQAVAQVESETVPPNSVIEEYQKGYFLHERIIRPAMVTVAKPQSNQETNTNSEQNCTEGG
ncbi:MAG: nucleotide exchange factor GrpE, partial [Nitrospirales bacterium]